MTKINSNLTRERCKIPHNEIFHYFNPIFVELTDSLPEEYLVYHRFNKKKILEHKIPNNHKFFFEKLYCPTKKLKTNDKTRDEIFPELKNLNYGENEWDLISFCYNYKNKWTLKELPVCAPIGYGKSCLIYYTLVYLRSRIKELKLKILPVILNLHIYRNELDIVKDNQEKLNNFMIKEVINPKLRNILSPYIDLKNEDFWNWYIENCGTDFLDKIKDVENTYEEEELKRFVNEIRIKEKDKDNFLFFATKYVNEKFDQRIVLVFDNLDPLNISINLYILWLIRKLVDISALRIIYTLRYTTYAKLFYEMAEVLPTSKLGWNTVPTSEIIKNRCDNIDQKVIEDYKHRPIMISGKKLQINDISKVLKAIIHSLIGRFGINVIEKMSLGDIRKELTLLRVTFNSGLIPEWMLGSAIISNMQFKEDYVIPNHLIVSSIVTHNYSTFFTETSLEIPGLINVYCSSFSANYLSIFSILMILSYLKKRTGVDYITTAELLNTLEYIFNKYNNKEYLFKAFNYSLTRLLRKGLISSPDTDKIKYSDKFSEEVKEIHLTELGLFYLDFLMTNPNYLVYVKDDVELDREADFTNCHTIRKHLTSNGTVNLYNIFFTNLAQTVKFVKIYGEMEISLYKELKKKSCLEYYKKHFSPEIEKMFSLVVASDLESFCKTHHENLSELFLTVKSHIYNEAKSLELIS